MSKLATIDESALFEGQVTQIAIGEIKSSLYSRDGTVPRTGSNLGTGSQPPEPEPNRF